MKRCIDTKPGDCAPPPARKWCGLRCTAAEPLAPWPAPCSDAAPPPPPPPPPPPGRGSAKRPPLLVDPLAASPPSPSAGLPRKSIHHSSLVRLMSSPIPPNTQMRPPQTQAVWSKRGTKDQARDHVQVARSM